MQCPHGDYLSFFVYLKGDIAKIHDANTHVLQHGQLLSWEHTHTWLTVIIKLLGV